MARRGQAAVPLGPTWAHMGAYVARRNRAMLIEPTGIVGPRYRIGGVLSQVGDKERLSTFPLYRRAFPSFSFVWDYYVSLFLLATGQIVEHLITHAKRRASI